MKRLTNLFTILLVGLTTAALTGCYDERLGPAADADNAGEATVKLEAAFSPFAGGDLSRASNVAPSRGFNSISDVVILTFSAADGKLVNIYEPENYQVKDADRVGANASNGITAETSTKSITGVTLKIPFGTYFIVAVANCGEYQSNNNGTITIKKSSLAKLSENSGFEIGTFSLDDLRSMKVSWDDNEYANNRAMLGYFAPADAGAPHSASKFEAVTVDRPNLELKAWMRRCVSKITVDFDGSSLSDNIRIYIKDVKICDLAADCTLGFGNPASDNENLVDFNNHPASAGELIHSGSSYIEIGSGADYNNWPCITKQSPFITESDGSGKKKDMHTQDSECLYFYENMQGVKTGYNRAPVPDLNQGGVAEGYNEKDGVPYGTYVEVTTHHIYEDNNQSIEQEIKYRFMLGKNVTDNFDAERNYHYKLTLRFLGNANEYHWHIDYNREEGFKVPNPWYVSYVYNHDAYLPFDFTLDNDWEVVDMKAKIVTNPWYPTTSSSNYGEGNDFDLTDPSYEITPETPYGDADYPYQTGDNKYTGNGFLSLRAPSEESVLTDTRVGTPWPGYGAADANKINQKYFDGVEAGVDEDGNAVAPVNHGERVIIANTFPSTEGTEREKISIKRNLGTYSINIPLFTREKALIKQTGYSGNNPFVGYQRVARIELSATARKKTDHSQTRDFTASVNVVQVRRVVNPKGVYRSSGNYEPFHVNLKFLTSEREDGEFQSIVSRGPWMAEVLGDSNFITLDGKQRVSGSSRSEIDFTIRFNRMGGKGNKNAIIRIKYHNYTCTHLIFVRQGYDAQAICPGGPVYNNSNAPATMWNTCNMIAGNVMADDPRDEGSMFKFGDPDYSIASVNNIYTDDSGQPIYHEQSRSNFRPQQNFTILNYDGTVNPDRKTWDRVGINLAGFSGAKTPDGTPMEISRTATVRDFEQLYLTKHIEFGYGVLYADGATTTQTSLEMVNGWYNSDPSPDKNKKGMRGVFAYYWNGNDPANHFNAKNIFFPIGRSGYGHRKNSKEELNDNNNGKGILRYSSNRAAPANDYGGVYTKFQDVSPLFEFLYRRMGAIYWARTITDPNAYLVWNGKTENAGTQAYGVDLNYFTFDVDVICGGALSYGNDACFVRTVKSSAAD